MSYECFELTLSEGIAHIRFNRPEKANSMIPSFWTASPRNPRNPPEPPGTPPELPEKNTESLESILVCFNSERIFEIL